MRKSLKERLQSKLRSGRGASITFALLLFLVCAVIGSVVLAAGTAASGRVSQLAEADRRYYAVTSAAQLFREELDGQSFTVVRTKETTTPYEKIKLDVNGEEVSGWDGSTVLEGEEVVEIRLTASEPKYEFRIEDSEGNNITDSSSKSLLADTSMELVFGKTEPLSSDVEVSWTKWEQGNQGFAAASWTTKQLTVYMGDSENQEAPVGVEVKLESSGNISFTFKDQEKGNEHYSVSFTLSLQNGATPVPGTAETVRSQINETKGQYTDKETLTNRFVWIATDIRSGS